jgi:predicted GTPase
MMKNYSKYRFDEVRNRLATAGFNPLDVMVTGVTGVGKSSTLNALFEKEVAKVGGGVAPETMDIESYSFNGGGIRFWDTPGLGDGVEADKRHTQKITQLLKKAYGSNNEYGFIDLVLIIIDAGSKDLGTSYELINKVVTSMFPQNGRLLVALNQCDMALKGKGWGSLKNEPSQELIQHLEQKVVSISSRIRETTNLNVSPIYYSAAHGYNIQALLDLIIDHIPSSRRGEQISDKIKRFVNVK